MKLTSLAAAAAAATIRVASANVASDGREAKSNNGRKLQSDGYAPGGPRYNFTLKNITEVAGRQGIAADGKGEEYFVSGSKALYVYNREGELLRSNEDPFAVGYDEPVNHIGDISYHDGEIYAGVEWFEDGQGTNIQIAIYDAETLNYTRSFPWDPSSGQVEVSSVAVDAANNQVWMTDWVSSFYLYRYDLSTGNYSGKLHLLPSPQWHQGIAVYEDHLFITADDGNADRKEHDNLWSFPSVPPDEEPTTANARHEAKFCELGLCNDFGEIEGLDFDDGAAELLVLSNRGRQIVNGMPMDFYPGYDREIHEVYVYGIEPIEEADPPAKDDDEDPDDAPDDAQPNTLDATKDDKESSAFANIIGAFYVVVSAVALPLLFG